MTGTSVVMVVGCEVSAGALLEDEDEGELLEATLAARGLLPPPPQADAPNSAMTIGRVQWVALVMPCPTQR